MIWVHTSKLLTVQTDHCYIIVHVILYVYFLFIQDDSQKAKIKKTTAIYIYCLSHVRQRTKTTTLMVTELKLQSYYYPGYYIDAIVKLCRFHIHIYTLVQQLCSYKVRASIMKQISHDVWMSVDIIIRCLYQYCYSLFAHHITHIQLSNQRQDTKSQSSSLNHIRFYGISIEEDLE